MIWREVMQLISAVLAVPVSEHRRQHCKPVLGPKSKVKAAALLPVPNPRRKLSHRHSVLSLKDGATADAIKNQLAPNLIDLS